MKQTQEYTSASPAWLLTYRDCMTLMLIFFLLFMSFSSFDGSYKLEKLKSVLHKQFFPLTRPADADIQSDAILQIPKTENAKNFHDKRVFIADSADIFWGDGAIISDNGKKIIAVLADFLRQLPNDIVICERPASAADEISPVASDRAWSVMEFLSNNGSITYERFKLSISGTAALPPSYKQGGRVLEIVLLEKGYSE